MYIRDHFEKPPRDEFNWMETASGARMYPLNPYPDDIVIEDVAHALSLTCRYSGHCSEFYSVAQHSVLVSLFCEDEKWGLMHDSSEAYFTDIPSPIKKFLPYISEIESEIEKCVAQKFGLVYPKPPSVKYVDLRMLKTEKDCLMRKGKTKWGIDDIEPFNIKIVPWTPKHAESMFLERFRELF